MVSAEQLPGSIDRLEDVDSVFENQVGDFLGLGDARERMREGGRDDCDSKNLMFAPVNKQTGEAIEGPAHDAQSAAILLGER